MKCVNTCGLQETFILLGFLGLAKFTQLVITSSSTHLSSLGGFCNHGFIYGISRVHSGGQSSLDKAWPKYGIRKFSNQEAKNRKFQWCLQAILASTSESSNLSLVWAQENRGNQINSQGTWNFNCLCLALWNRVFGKLQPVVEIQPTTYFCK